MEEFSEELWGNILRFYRAIGLKEDDFFKSNNILSLYEILGIFPEFDENGRRILTPYEILGIPPIIIKGKEVPIVFAIKNKTKKIRRIGTIDDSLYKFIYKPKRVKEQDTLLEELKKKYKQALIQDNDELAQQLLMLIDEVTGGRSVDFLLSFYDYTKFYRRMKKQLLIDLFNHFFLLFMMQNRLNMTEGVIKDGKVYKSFVDEDNKQKQEEVSGFSIAKQFLGGKGGPKVSKIKVKRGDDALITEKPKQKNTETVASSQKPSDAQKPPKQEIPERYQRKGRNGYLGKRRRFGRYRKYQPDEMEFEPIIEVPPIIPVFQQVDEVEQAMVDLKNAASNAEKTSEFEVSSNDNLMKQTQSLITQETSQIDKLDEKTEKTKEEQQQSPTLQL